MLMCYIVQAREIPSKKVGQTLHAEARGSAKEKLEHWHLAWSRTVRDAHRDGRRFFLSQRPVKHNRGEESRDGKGRWSNVCRALGESWKGAKTKQEGEEEKIDWTMEMFESRPLDNDIGISLFITQILLLLFFCRMDCNAQQRESLELLLMWGRN